MTEVEKLYELAGVEREILRGCYDYYSSKGIDIWDIADCKNTGCKNCKYDKSIKHTPPFTAEKQIEITQKLWEFKPNEYPNFDLLTHYSYGEMVAELANHLWQDLTETEQEEIRKILKG